MNRRIISAIILGIFCAMPALAATSDHSFTIIKRMPEWFNPPEQTDNGGGDNGGGTDITAPQVTALSPADGANDADPNASLVMTFGENVIAGSGSVNIYSDNDGLFESFDVASSSGIAVNGNQVTITPTLPLDVSTSYYVNVDAGAFRDAAGNVFAGMSTQGDWDFTTADADTNAPHAISFIPSRWEMGVAADTPTLTVSFDEPVTIASGNINLVAIGDPRPMEMKPMASWSLSFDVQGGAVSVNGTEATIAIDQKNPLLAGSWIGVSIDQGAFQDAAGNPSDAVTPDDWAFETAAAGGGVLACGDPLVPGCLAADDTVYVGLSPDGDVPMYVPSCDAGMSWDGSSCSGMRAALVWGTYGTATGLADLDTGEANTAALATIYGDTDAATYCYNLDLHGHSDWYLPAMYELNAIYQASAAAGGAFGASFDTSLSYPSGYYWSSSEGDEAYNYDENYAAYIILGDGTLEYDYKASGLSVRCARKEGAALEMAVQQGDPAAMDITGGSSPGSDVVFTITNTGEAASGTMAVALTGDAGNFSKTTDTCDGQTLAASASCSITVQPIATADGSYMGTLEVSGIPGGTLSRGLSGTASGFVSVCGGSPVPGCLAADGTVYAGLSPDGDVPMYVTRCDAGMTWDGSACSGTRSAISWNNGTSNWTTTGITDANAGEANTAALAGLSDAGAPYQAANYCEGLASDGKTDWYLPASNELDVVYLASVSAGGSFRDSFNLIGSFPLINYLTSSEWDNANPSNVRFTDGFKYEIRNKNYELPVRCARKDSAALGMDVQQGDPAAMNITGGSSPGGNVVFTITNSGEAASGTITVSITGDTGNFSKTADTCNGQALAAADTCSITVQPIATADGSYTGTLEVSASPGGTFNQALSGTASGFVPPDPCAGSPASGTVCLDGTVYVGLSPDGNVPMYTTRCDEGASWNGSSCAGTSVTLSWGTWGTTTGATSAITGETNTATVAAYADAYVAKRCDESIANGKTDWYVPAKNELAKIFQNYGTMPGMGTGYYWSSTEEGLYSAFCQSFSNGQSSTSKTTDMYRVRCVRKALVVQGASCKAINDAHPAYPSGIYEIDPDGEGTGIDSFQVYCDMTGDEVGLPGTGGWMLFVRDPGPAYDVLQPPAPTNAWVGDLAGKSGFLAADYNAITAVAASQARIRMVRHDGSVMGWYQDVWHDYSGIGMCIGNYPTWRAIYLPTACNGIPATTIMDIEGYSTFYGQNACTSLVNHAMPACSGDAPRSEGTAGPGDYNSRPVGGCTGSPMGPDSGEIWIR